MAFAVLFLQTVFLTKRALVSHGRRKKGHHQQTPHCWLSTLWAHYEPPKGITPLTKEGELAQNFAEQMLSKLA